MNPCPSNEQERLAAVHRYNILDTPPEPAFDQLTALIARLFDVPVVIISIVDRDRVWLKSCYGLDLEEIEREIGICASAIEQDDVYTVNDATLDIRTFANPLVVGEFNLRFYAGAPLRTNDGFNLGMIGIIDFQPRLLSEVEKIALQDLAAIVINQLELRLLARKAIELQTVLELQARQVEQSQRIANTDALTGLLNRRAFDQAIEELGQISWFERNTVVVIIDIDSFKAVNDLLGHQQGDLLLKVFGEALHKHFRSQDLIYRLGGDEFALLLSVEGNMNLDLFLEEIHYRLSGVIESIRIAGLEQVSASFGMATMTEANYDFQEAVQLADSRMYIEKRRKKS